MWMNHGISIIKFIYLISNEPVKQNSEISQRSQTESSSTKKKYILLFNDKNANEVIDDEIKNRGYNLGECIKNKVLFQRPLLVRYLWNHRGQGFPFKGKLYTFYLICRYRNCTVNGCNISVVFFSHCVD